jgi:hypothetical protein
MGEAISDLAHSSDTRRLSNARCPGCLLIPSLRSSLAMLRQSLVLLRHKPRNRHVANTE